ncbi:hypothetical protein CLOBOL_03309 [Enterocloster bolteae ATCC BAA-613]|uniref:Uncharacterized protein n=1 Tax=Enterocloster bolteae (strain ATCC BAA-613 / DSM 15670 / CCUG 46953 / JCM 12243 / WAL 16351) TaxID=411902 RepID=A8RSG0_ENTBW|nr:hypothetical protein CLOBOL_03309 [Enterocloster bolteae ATCC BAA-613]
MPHRENAASSVRGRRSITKEYISLYVPAQAGRKENI